MILQLSVESWDFLELLHPLVVLHSDKELVPSGWITWDVQVVRPALAPVLIEAGEDTTVVIMKMLECFVNVSTTQNI